MQKGLSVNFLHVFCDLFSAQSQNSGRVWATTVGVPWGAAA